MNIDPSIRKLLDNETTIHEAQIRALFQTLDRKFGLRGASVPIRFGYDEAVLGSYTPASAHEKGRLLFFPSVYWLCRKEASFQRGSPGSL